MGRIKKDTIEKVLNRYNEVVSEIYHDGLTLDDFTSEELVDMIYEKEC